jgi:alpha-aminoadipate/glutamate carrier protein LysW
MAICPECEFEIDIDEYDVDRGDTLECDNCGVTLEIIGLNPIEFEVASDDDEDEDEEDEEKALDTDEDEADEDDDE